MHESALPRLSHAKCRETSNPEFRSASVIGLLVGVVGDAPECRITLWGFFKSGVGGVGLSLDPFLF